jgi:hypothetical protein
MPFVSGHLSLLLGLVIYVNDLSYSLDVSLHFLWENMSINKQENLRSHHYSSVKSMCYDVTVSSETQQICKFKISILENML